MDFTLTGPANFDNRLFNISEGISLKLVHNTNVEISISPKADPENVIKILYYNKFIYILYIECC